MDKTFKELLQGYKEYESQIKMKEYQIAVLNEQDIGIGGGIPDGMPKGTGYIETIWAKQADNRMDSIKRLENEINVLKSLLELIDSIINTLSTQQQEYVKQRYVLNYTIRQVADRNGIDHDSMKVTLQSICDKLEYRYKKIREG